MKRSSDGRGSGGGSGFSFLKNVVRKICLKRPAKICSGGSNGRDSGGRREREEKSKSRRKKELSWKYPQVNRYWAYP